MTLTDEQLAEILAGCEGVTPGPWFPTGAPWFRANDGVLCGSPDGNIAYLIADCDDGFDPRDEYTGPFPLGDKDADAAHIARLDPQTVAALVTELQERRAGDRALLAFPQEQKPLGAEFEAVWDAHAKTLYEDADATALPPSPPRKD